MLNLTVSATILKLLIIVLCAAALFLFLRTISSRNLTAQNSHMRATQLDGRNFVRANSPSTSVSNGTADAPVADDLGRIRVTRLNFSQFDAVPGPPDPECFVDELLVELLDPVEDHRWTMTFVVATPLGIRKLMDDERWSFFYTTEVFVVRRYDFPTIRQAVYGRIREIHDSVGLLQSGSPPLAG